jgi:tetratricopeptide (TPR) repeat protein
VEAVTKAAGRRPIASVAVITGAIAAVTLAVPGSAAGAQQLGTITFPTSAPTAAQGPFVRGVLFLHSFEYESAANLFREAQRIAPHFALAYWGEAMTYTHPVWNEQDLAKARAVLSRLGPDSSARRAKAGTRREQMFLDAIEALYGDGPKARRDTLYANVMERVAAEFPTDDEAQTFYALALLGLNQGVRDVPTYMKAGAIAQDVLRRNEDHPGAAHYTIHAFDDPIHAVLGLRAARLYSKIAPSAPHAQHMTTHIFVAMGMWDDVVSQNIAAAGHDHGQYQAGHYTAWLGYGYTQQGRMEEARKHLETMRANYRRTARRGEDPSLLSMRAQYIINSERWSDPVTSWQVEAPNAGVVALSMDAFTSAYAALKRGDRAGARKHHDELLRRSRGTAVDDAYSSNTAVPGILDRMLRAMFSLDEGNRTAALALLREATQAEDRIPLEFGPPDVVKPSHELLGEVLLGLGEAAEARREFTRALALAPGRARSLLGLGRAALAVGDTAAARKALGDLKRAWHSADARLPEVAELDRLLAQMTGGK